MVLKFRNVEQLWPNHKKEKETNQLQNDIVTYDFEIGVWAICGLSQFKKTIFASQILTITNKASTVCFLFNLLLCLNFSCDLNDL